MYQMILASNGCNSKLRLLNSFRTEPKGKHRHTCTQPVKPEALRLCVQQYVWPLSCSSSTGRCRPYMGHAWLTMLINLFNITRLARVSDTRMRCGNTFPYTGQPEHVSLEKNSSFPREPSSDASPCAKSYIYKQMSRSSLCMRNCCVVVWGQRDTWGQKRSFEGNHWAEASPWCCEMIHMHNPICTFLLLSAVCFLGLSTVNAASQFPMCCFVSFCCPAFDKHVCHVPRRDRQSVFSSTPPFLSSRLHDMVLHAQRCLSPTVQSNTCSIKWERRKQLPDTMLMIWKLHHFNVACHSTDKGWWIGDGCLSDQFLITVLHFTGPRVWRKDTWMQSQLKSIKLELLAQPQGVR